MAALHFPLCLLSRDIDERTIIDDLIGFAIYNSAMKLPEEVVDCEIEDLFDFPGDYEEDNYDHIKMCAYAERVGISLGSLHSISTRHGFCQSYVDNYEIEYGKDAWTQFNSKIIFNVRDGKFSYELFSIICAINAILGKEAKYKRITLERIKAAMNGYKSNEICEKELKQKHYRDDKIISLPDHTLRRRIIKLSDEGLNFFRRYTYKSRETYYSTQIKDEFQLMEQVIEFKSKRKGLDKKQIEMELLNKYGMADEVQW